MSVGFFLTRFKHRTDQELQTIIDGEDFAVDAKEAARIILKEREASGLVIEPVEETKSPPPLPSLPPPLPSEKMGIHPFNGMIYLRSWTVKDLITHLTIGIAWLAIYQLLIYYNNEPEIFPIVRNTGLALYFTTIVFNHVLYRKDHGRSNNYLGRCMSDLAFFITFIISDLFFNTLFRNNVGTLSITEENLIQVMVGLCIIFMAVEAVIALLKYLLRLLKWEIL